MTGTIALPGALPPLHAEWLARFVPLLADDERFLAVLGAGSLLHGGFDEHSDLDLVLVVRDDDHAGILAQRDTIARLPGALLSAFTGEHVGEPRLMICLYGPPLLHVDLKFVTADALDKGVEAPRLIWARDADAIARRLAAAEIQWPACSAQWFEDRAWIWLHYGAVKLARGELFEAIGMLAFLREQVLGPMLHRRAGRPQRGVRRIELIDPGASAALRPILAAHDPEAVRQALRHAIALYLSLRDDDPPSRPTAGMPELLGAFIDEDGRGRL